MEENKTEKATAEKDTAPKKEKKKSEADELRAEIEALKASFEAEKKELISLGVPSAYVEERAARAAAKANAEAE